MPTPVLQKHYARVYVTKGAYIGSNSDNVLAKGQFLVSDIRDDGTHQSDAIEPVIGLTVIRPDVKFYPGELVVTVDSNATEMNSGVKVALEY
jgi:hypothetical protein